MKARILALTLGITLICLITFSIASTDVYYKSAVDESKIYLGVYMNEYNSELYPATKSGADAFSLKLGGARVTFIGPDGAVIADSRKDIIEENHSERREVLEALANGSGFTVRSSATLNENMAYYCRNFEGYLVRIAVSVPSAFSIFKDTLPALAIYIAADILLCVVISFVATHYILNPVKRLTAEAAGNTQVSGKYSELKPIAQLLNERNRDNEIQMNEIMSEKEAADKARASKDEFISNVTHEMNTPLTSIRGYAELLNAGGLTDEQKSLAYSTIARESDRLTNLIACIINYSEIDSENLPSYEVNFSALTMDMLDSLAPEAEKNCVTLIPEIDNDVIVMSRHEILSEILGNLTRNAIRYNKKGGSVTVKLTNKALTVSDTGIGIAEENIDKIFDRFFTVDKSHDGKNGGFGLGLAVVKKICRKAGWTLDVKSVLGEGSCFRIEFSDPIEKPTD